MNMNKKILLCLTLIFSVFIFNLKVNAACNDVYSSNPYPTEEQCGQYSENNFKCKGNGYSGGTVSKLRCEKSDECVDGYKKDGDKCVKSDSTTNSSSSNSTNNSDIDVNKVECTKLDNKACKMYRGCKWTGSSCIDNYVAAEPCNDDNVKTALRFVGYILMIAKVAIPLIIIVMATFDLFKSVIDKDEKSFSKQVKIVLMRIVAGIFVFFLPTIVYALFNLSSELNIVDDAKYQGCATCLLKPTECSISEK